MVDVEEVDDELKEDILGECRKFGELKNMYIHIEDTHVFIFLHYSDATGKFFLYI
jgi:hypothetical protein